MAGRLNRQESRYKFKISTLQLFLRLPYSRKNNDWGRGTVKKNCINIYINSFKWYLPIKEYCICLVFRFYFMLKRCISLVRLEKESIIL